MLRSSRLSSIRSNNVVRQTRSFSGHSRLRRVLFNVPGSDIRKITKATQLDVDSVVLDLEDGVAANQKENARKLVSQTLLDHHVSFGRSERLVRINSFGSGLEDGDLQSLKEAFTEGAIDGVVIPKAKKVQLLAAIESAKAIIDLKDICKAKTNRLAGLIFASEDYVADVGMTRTEDASELYYARSHLVNHAVAFRMQSIDMVCLNFKDVQIIAKETTEGRLMGFTGKQCIHPNQIVPIIEAFVPSEREIDFARKITEANDRHQAEGRGAFEVDGKMVDRPLYLWAERIMQRYNASVNQSN
ncbi:hypothetical protein PROFUN_01622 [Planoprotostelium fungivorum]|uniref:HpcH/HpaI aldolase/citrate lyase domain-containing protein n=1 Tax=Planoprotostelium fungivorum TaxID=1890364 RepID=A0A2P6NTW1_9EUKA|nr:hypothetical protein PROFUN_01622 [Planoprotostelium fungivorum]